MVITSGEPLAAALNCLIVLSGPTIFILAAILFYRRVTNIEARLSALEGKARDNRV
jgi:hypothetical protein